MLLREKSSHDIRRGISDQRRIERDGGHGRIPRSHVHAERTDDATEEESGDGDSEQNVEHLLDLFFALLFQLLDIGLML